MQHLVLRITSAGAAAFFGGLFIGWIVLGKPFTGPDKAEATPVALEFKKVEKPTVVAAPREELPSPPAAAPRETDAPKAPPLKVAEPAMPQKTEEPQKTEDKPAPPAARPADTPRTQPDAKVTPPAATPTDVFPTRKQQKKIVKALPQVIIGLLNDDDDD